jgi:hypothetical protein
MVFNQHKSGQKKCRDYPSCLQIFDTSFSILRHRIEDGFDFQAFSRLRPGKKWPGICFFGGRMWLSKLFTALLVALTGLLPSSCTTAKKPAAQNTPAQKQPASVAADVSAVSTNRNLGELNLTNYYEADIELGAGKSCRITPKVIGRGSLQLTMALESKKIDGQIAGLSVTQVIARPGQPFEVALGDMNFTLTPNIVSE